MTHAYSNKKSQSENKYRPYAICILSQKESTDSKRLHQKLREVREIKSVVKNPKLRAHKSLFKSQSKKPKKIFQLPCKLQNGFQVNNITVQFKLLTYIQGKVQNQFDEIVIEIFCIEKKLRLTVFLPSKYNNRQTFNSICQNQIYMCQSYLYARLNSDLIQVNIYQRIYTNSQILPVQFNLLNQVNQKSQGKDSTNIKIYENVIRCKHFHGVFRFFNKNYMALQQPIQLMEQQNKNIYFKVPCSMEYAQEQISFYQFCLTTDFTVQKLQITSNQSQQKTWFKIYERLQNTKVHIISFHITLNVLKKQQKLCFSIIKNTLKIQYSQNSNKLHRKIQYFLFNILQLRDLLDLKNINLQIIIFENKTTKKQKDNYILAYQKFKQWIAVFSFQKDPKLRNNRRQQQLEVFQGINASKILLQFVYFTDITIYDLQIQKATSHNTDNFVCYTGIKQDQEKKIQLQCLSVKNLFRSSKIGIQLQKGQFVYSVKIAAQSEDNPCLLIVMNQKVLNRVKYQQKFMKDQYEIGGLQNHRKVDFSALRKLFIYYFCEVHFRIFQVIQLPFPIHSIKSDTSFFENLRIKKGKQVKNVTQRQQTVQNYIKSQKKDYTEQFALISQIRPISPKQEAFASNILQQSQFKEIRNFLSKIVSENETLNKLQQFQVSQMDDQGQFQDQIQDSIESLNTNIFHKNVNKICHNDPYEQNKQAIDNYSVLTLKNLMNQIQNFRISKNYHQMDQINYQTINFGIQNRESIDIASTYISTSVHINQTFQILRLYFLYFQQNELYLPNKVFHNADSIEQKSEHQFNQFLYCFTKNEQFSKTVICSKILANLSKTTQNEQIGLLQCLCSKKLLLKNVLTLIKLIDVSNQAYSFLVQHGNRLFEIVANVDSQFKINKQLTQVTQIIDPLSVLIKLKNKKKFFQQFFQYKLQQFEYVYSKSIRTKKSEQSKKQRQILNVLQRLNLKDWKQIFERLILIDPFKNPQKRYLNLEKNRQCQNRVYKSIQDLFAIFKQIIEKMVKPIKTKIQPLEVEQAFIKLIDQIKTNVGEIGFLQKGKAQKLHQIMLQVYKLLKNHVNILNGKLNRSSILNFVKSWHFLIKMNRDHLISQKVIQKKDILKVELLQEAHKYQRNTNCLITFQEIKDILQKNKKRYQQNEWNEYQQKIDECFEK